MSKLLSRLHHITMWVQASLRRLLRLPAPPPAKEAGKSKVSACLLSMGVAPDYVGSTVAFKMLERVCKQMSADGVDQVGTYVAPENGPAIRLYYGTGWQREEVDDPGFYFYRSTRPPTRPSVR